MKKILVAVAILAMTAVPAMAGPSAGQTFYWWESANSTTHSFTAVGNLNLTLHAGWTSGGSFDVNLVSGSLPHPGFPAYSPGNNLFTTYCIENGITFTPGTNYTASIDASAFQGHQLSGDPISKVTENIYGNWLNGMNGIASGWTNLGFTSQANMLANQGTISQAIWYAEGESGGVANSVYNLILAAVGGTNGNGAGYVKALNLWSFGSGMTTEHGVTGWWATDVQTQLILTAPFTPVPVPGAALLGMLGLSAMTWAKKRFA